MEKTITIDDFDKAVPEVATEITMEHLDKIEGALMFTTAGIAFAKELRKKLFDKEEE